MKGCCAFVRSGAFLAVLLTSTSATAAGRPDLVRHSLESGRPYATGEVLVQFGPVASPAQRKMALDRVGGEIAERVTDTLVLARVPIGVPMSRALEQLGAHAAVAFAEPNWLYQHAADSNDWYFANGWLWGMYGDTSSPYANEYGSQAAEAWSAGFTCDSQVYVGIIDEGFMHEHEDLAANVWTNPFDPVDGIDNDGNGYVDDQHGWDFDGKDNSTFDGLLDDHGTHVAGTVAAVGGNEVGVAGMCWSARLISAKFLGRRFGTTANAVKAVDYITDLKLRHGLNIVATNNSWGGGGFSQALYDAIARADAAGILFVAAAGNDTADNDSVPDSPSGYDLPNIIAVASIRVNGELSSFSNWGASTVDIGAPGDRIYSTVPERVGTTEKGHKGKPEDSPAKPGRGKPQDDTFASAYAQYSGTSMAAPHVTGAALLYASMHPEASHLQIRSAILDSATPTASLSGKCATGGRLNVGDWVSAQPPVCEGLTCALPLPLTAP